MKASTLHLQELVQSALRSSPACSEALRAADVERLHEAAVLLRVGSIQLLVYMFREGQPDAELDDIKDRAAAHGAGLLLLLPANSDIPDQILTDAHTLPHFDFLESPVEPDRVARHLQRLLRNLEWEDTARRARRDLKANRAQLKEVQSIGVALSAERDLDRLLDMIVDRARALTCSDAGSLYIVEGREKHTDVEERRLRFKISQNDSIQVPFSEFTLPINRSSIAGYVAETNQPLNIDDVYAIPAESPFSFNSSFDTNFHYRTRSMLVVPLINRNGDMIGVLQLINRKWHADSKLTPEEVAEKVTVFSPADEELVNSLASAAAVSLDNAFLYEEIHRLFEGFVRASVTAIESRDPTTSGHSDRVATLTVGMAETVDRVTDGKWGPVQFSRDQLREIEYASLLHDFGKIGVREQVLVKANKLYPQDFALVESRFKFVRKCLENDFLRKQNELLLTKGRRGIQRELTRLEKEYRQEVARLGEFMNIIQAANRPTVLAEGDFAALQDIAAHTFEEEDGSAQPLLTAFEVLNLSLPKGSLNSAERKEIESHVTHTFEFLQRIPWTKGLRDIPLIASLHHEKLDGKGYPFGYEATKIPVQSRMMTISDIFDALTASDRPYKKAMPVEKALDIIGSEVKQGFLDADLYEVFLDAKIYKLTT